MKRPVASPYKINLFLDIEGKRSDGFHDLRSVFLECKSGDVITVNENFTGTSDDRRFFVNGRFASETPTTPDNLFLRAISAYANAVGEDETRYMDHIAFTLTKNVPLQAGLGGGSANGAVALKIANEQNPENPLEPEQLEALAATLGSDCPFFIRGGVQLATGRGEGLKPLAVRRKPSVVVLVPQARVHTGQAFAHLDPGADFGLKSRGDLLIEWMQGRGSQSLAEIPLQNAFQRSVCERFPEVIETLEVLRSFNPAHALLSGSGSACFALFDGPIPEAVRNTVEELESDSWFRLAKYEEFS